VNLAPAGARERLPLAAAAATGIQVGAATVASRYAIAETDPATLAFLRYAVGVCFLLPAVLAAGSARIAGRDLLPIGLLGIGQFGVLILLLNYGLTLIPAGRATVIFASFPLLTLLLAAALRQERVTAPKCAGVLLSIIGVALALADKAFDPAGSAGGWAGELAVLGGALCGALCSVLYRPYLRKYPALPVSAFAMLASVGLLALPAAARASLNGPPQFSAAGWLAVLFIGASSGIGYVLWLYALGRIAATRVTVCLALSPLTAVLLGALLLDEAITAPTVLGVAAVAAGLWLALQGEALLSRRRAAGAFIAKPPP